MTDDEIRWQIEVHAEYQQADQERKTKIFRMMAEKRRLGGDPP